MNEETFTERFREIEHLMQLRLLSEGELIEVGIELEGNDGYAGPVYVLNNEEELVVMSPPEGETIGKYFIRKEQVQIGAIENIMTQDGQRVRQQIITAEKDPTQFNHYQCRWEAIGWN
ncbi:hypothetical protein CMI46_01095 [Candidatus Pacearchaeota archaeon]|nr:hypothetical protein [Candidatus Pacearchaeota archaeon]|tara:strand:+ start:7774 stop:8127 length:354 start_codon:yes stop_codon:yes gene_type:complete